MPPVSAVQCSPYVGGSVPVLLTTQEVADRLRKSVSWVHHARQDGTGPRYLKIGHQVRYKPEDIEAWLEAQARTRVWDFGDGKVA